MKLKTHFTIIGILGCLAVILGAFGAHSLKELISSTSLASYKTGVQYQFYHTITACLMLIMALRFDNKGFVKAFWLFIIGIILFSGSIYLLSLKSLFDIGFYKIIGPLTPIGGIFFILGWIQFVLTVRKLEI